MAKLKAAYTLGELQEMSGLSQYRLKKLLVSNGVEIARSGNRPVVFLNGLKTGLPDLWESILEVVALSRAA